ncbi:hypothetical protein V8359_12960, partial [Roseovarius sp. E0-M6]
MTMPELAGALVDATGVQAHPDAIGRFLRKLKRFAFNLRHQRKAKRVQRLNVALRFAQICDSGFSR